MSLLIELIQIALGNCQALSIIPSEQEWNAIYHESIHQAVVGVAFEGVRKLPKEQWPPQALLFEWIGYTEQIKKQNLYVNKQTSIIWNKLKDDGLNAVILKGQGIAQDYGPIASLRQPGDIDVWIKGGYETVCEYVLRSHPTDDVAYHRFHYDFFDDTEVELHHRPTLMRNLFDDRKLAKWYNSFDADSFVYLEDMGFAVPPMEFNRVFILTHIYRHFLFEGIGLKQVIDYYYVLKSCTEFPDHTNQILKDLRLKRFAEAMMWILHEIFGLEKRYLICGMNEKEGMFVLNEIRQTGNFGFSDTRYRYKRFFKLRRQIAHGTHLLIHYPSEVLWTPVWLVYHKVWKWNKLRMIHQNNKNSL